MIYLYISDVTQQISPAARAHTLAVTLRSEDSLIVHTGAHGNTVRLQLDPLLSCQLQPLIALAYCSLELVQLPFERSEKLA